MRKIERISHQPKGGMCKTCKKWRDDCSGLPFTTMPVIKVFSDDVKVVRCTEHVRSYDLNDI